MKTEIKQYIESNIPDLAGKVYPVFTTDINTLSVKYTITPVTGGHLPQSQIELVIIGPDYDECQKIEARLCSLLDMEPDKPPVWAADILFHSELAGGGILFNDACQMFEDTLYFIIDWRKCNGERKG